MFRLLAFSIGTVALGWNGALPTSIDVLPFGGFDAPNPTAAPNVKHALWNGNFNGFRQGIRNLKRDLPVGISQTLCGYLEADPLLQNGCNIGYTCTTSGSLAGCCTTDGPCEFATDCASADATGTSISGIITCDSTFPYCGTYYWQYDEQATQVLCLGDTLYTTGTLNTYHNTIYSSDQVTCGYSSASLASPYNCPSDATCSNANYGAGCCPTSATQCIYPTSCVEYDSVEDYTSSISADGGVITTDSTTLCSESYLPYCYTRLLDFSSFTLTDVGCASDAGVSEDYSYTAMYSDVPATTTTTSDMDPKQNTITRTIFQTGTSSASSQQNGSGSSTPVGAIVGGVVGGLAVIGAIVVALLFIFRRRSPKSKENPGPLHPHDQGPPPSQPLMTDQHHSWVAGAPYGGHSPYSQGIESPQLTTDALTAGSYQYAPKGVQGVNAELEGDTAPISTVLPSPQKALGQGDIHEAPNTEVYRAQ